MPDDPPMNASRPSQSVSLIDVGKETRGAKVSVSFPKNFLGYARRLTGGILGVLAITDPELECVICCDVFEKDQEMAQLNCGHV